MVMVVGALKEMQLKIPDLFGSPGCERAGSRDHRDEQRTDRTEK